MPLTKEQAMSANVVHNGEFCDTKIYRWRRNGKTQTWVTRPGDFRMPVKYGMYDYGAVNQDNAQYFHTEEDCPALQATRAALAAERESGGTYISFGPLTNPDGSPSDVTLDMLAGTGRHLTNDGRIN